MIYVIESGDYFKVGFTAKDFQTERAKTYDTHNPDWNLISTHEGNKKLETKLLKLLKPYKSKGEWFNKFNDWYDLVYSYIKNNEEEFVKPSDNMLTVAYESYKDWDGKFDIFILDRKCSNILGKKQISYREFIYYVADNIFSGIMTKVKDGKVYVQLITEQELLMLQDDSYG